ncbi:Hypothetical predicted protein [Cloeon dipterum]|uniref:Sulfotransferase domain-containing protein n=1 Tax=Cloeon dipterum TaxID=197152 RepID=A0A8S1C7U9_9INSE|nr:Hypothetical predicted protein [Cloeon dipterum]
MNFPIKVSPRARLVLLAVALLSLFYLILDSYLTNDTSGCSLQRDHIFFLKMHKCGSSTVQNILMRRGFQRELNFVLPRNGHYLGHPEPFRRSHVDARFLSFDATFHVLAHHSRFSPCGVAEVMPPDAVKVTILREPVDLFESLYNYYKLNRARYGQSLGKLLKFDLQMLKSMAKSMPRWGGRIGFNQMAFDVGLMPEDFYKKWRVNQTIKHMDEQFDLVMISEHMEASLVLLADTMCWPLEEVAFVSLNRRLNSTTVRTKLSDTEKEKLRKVNWADARIYDHFKGEFERKVREYGEAKMEAKVAELKRLNAQLADECISQVIEPENPSKDYPVFIYQINENATEVCKLVVMEELDFTAMLKRVQLERFSHLEGDVDDA